MRSGILDAIFPPLGRAARNWRPPSFAVNALSFAGVALTRDIRAGDLPHGLQRLVEITRAIAGEPRALLLDEPAAGLNPGESEQLIDLIQRINARVRPS